MPVTQEFVEIDFRLHSFGVINILARVFSEIVLAKIILKIKGHENQFFTNIS